MDLLQQLDTFVRIADQGSISRAARSLGLSVAMASRHLRSLEREFGVELMRRNTRHLALTEAGQELLVRARNVLSNISEARDVLRPGRGAAGLLIVSLPVSFGLSQVGPLFPQLLERHPRLRLDLRFEDRLVDLLAEGIDLAVRAGVRPPDSPFLSARRIATLRRVLCASPAFLARHRRIHSVADLARIPCVLQGAPPTLWSFETPEGLQEVKVDGRFRSNNVFAMREAALAGLGIARLPEWIMADDLQKKRLVPVLPDLTIPIVEIFGVYHRSARGSAAIAAVLDFLQTELPGRAQLSAV
jgi:DNA-binding transcriptional LysR family regulator